MAIPRCWEITDCGRQKGGSRVHDLGESITSKKGLGHFCWTIAGTLSGKKARCTTAQQRGDCLQCEVYVLRHGFSDEEYARISASNFDHVADLLLHRDGGYARICPALRADGELAVESAVGQDTWRRIVEAIDASERRNW